MQYCEQGCSHDAIIMALVLEEGDKELEASIWAQHAGTLGAEAAHVVYRLAEWHRDSHDPDEAPTTSIADALASVPNLV